MSNKERVASRPYNVQSLDRALMALVLLRDNRRGEMGLSELSRELGLHRSTLHRLLATLLRHGFVAQDPISKRYRLGLAYLPFGHAAVEHLEVRRHALRHMHALADDSGESVYLNILAGGLMLCVDGVVGPRSVTVDTNAGVALPLHATATGKCFLAWMSPAERDTYLARERLVPVTQRTIVEPAELLAQLDAVRRQGYATNDEETEPGVRYVAAPIFDQRGEIVASISIGFPVLRVSQADLPRYAAAVMAAAARISASLSYAGDRGAPSGYRLVVGDAAPDHDGAIETVVSS